MPQIESNVIQIKNLFLHNNPRSVWPRGSLIYSLTRMRVTPNHRNLIEMPFGQIMPSWTVAMERVQLQYLVLTSEYKAQFFPSCLKCFAFILENF